MSAPILAARHLSVVLNAVDAYARTLPDVTDVDGDQGEVILRFRDGSDLTVTVQWDTERRDDE